METLLWNFTGNGTVTSVHDLDELWNDVIRDFQDSLLTLNEPSTVVLLVLYVPIFLISVVGNGLVLLVLVPNQRIWTVTNSFLVNLAVADLLGNGFITLSYRKTLIIRPPFEKDKI